MLQAPNPQPAETENPQWATRDPAYIPRRYRQLFPQASGKGLLDRAVAVLWPWEICEYPGVGRLRAWLLGDVSVLTGASYRKIDLPKVRVPILLARLRSKRDALDRIIAEVEALLPANVSPSAGKPKVNTRVLPLPPE